MMKVAGWCLLMVLGMLAWAAPVAAARDPLTGFGGEDGLATMTEEFVEYLRNDPRVGAPFRTADPERLTQLLKNFFCVQLGGDCKYKGKSMHDAHKDMIIRMSDFNALVECLQRAMRKYKVPFRDQMKLLSKLAPLRKDIVTR
jgi:hemoglobin